MNEFKIIVSEWKPKIICLSETRQTKDILDQELVIDNYELIRCDSNNRRTGGCVIYVKNNIQYNLIKNVNIDQCWILIIKITNGFKKGIYGVIYKSPKQKKKKFIKIIDDTFENIIEDSNFNLICGDFNEDLSKQTLYGGKLVDLFAQHNLIQIIKENTRVTNHSATLIDYVITNNDCINYEIDEKNRISDHSIIKINSVYQEIKSISHNKLKTFYKYSEYKMMSELIKHDFIGQTMNDIDSKISYMNLCFSKAIEKMTIKKNINAKYAENDWYDADCLNRKNERNFSYRIYKNNKTLQNWKKYVLVRNQYKCLIRKKHCDFYRNKIMQYKNDSRKLWKILKSMYKEKNKKIKMVKFENNEITDHNELAEKFNEFYVESIKEIIDLIPTVRNTDFIELIEKNTNEFKFKPINSEIVKKILQKNKNKSFIDGVSGRMILDCMKNENFAKFFVGIINSSMINGIVPEKWKITVIEPIEKSKNAVFPEQFRPINKLPIAEKVLEAVIKEQMEVFLAENSILVEQQSGFRKFHSCESTINHVLHNWKVDLENDKKIVTISLDFKRAFETINRTKLIEILSRYGVRNNELDWFNDYFTNRKQKVKIENAVSNERIVEHGVSQGSCLGPLTYLLAVNYLPLVLQHSTVNMFADDTLITVTSDSINDAVFKLNEDLETLYEWINYNNLALNISKTKYMIIANKKSNLENFEIKIGGEKIEKVSEIKYLGVKIDDKLKFLSHLKYIKNKLSTKLALFRRISKKLDFQTKVVLYKSIVAPHFDYCSSILFSLPNSRIKELQKLQNKFMRIILQANKYTSVELMLKTLRFQSVEQRLAFNSLKLMYKIDKGLAPSYLKKYMKKNKERYKYNLRRKSLFEIPRFTKTINQRSFFYKTLMLYNEFVKDFGKEINDRNYTIVLKKFLKIKYT
jgi:hypothetical protein